MGKARKVEETSPRPFTKRQASRWQRERRRELFITALVGGSIALIVLVLAYGALNQYVIQPSRPVATVNGEEISRTDYIKRQKFDLLTQISFMRQLAATSPGFDSQIQTYQQQLLTVAKDPPSSSTVESMIDDQIVVQKAADLGISSADLDVDQALRQDLLGVGEDEPTAPAADATASAGTAAPSPAASPTTQPAPSPTMDPATEQSLMTERLTFLEQQTGLTADDYKRLIVVPRLLRDQVQKKLGEQVPANVEQVHARHILVATEDEANAIVAEIRADPNPDQKFAEVAKEKSTDTGSKDSGGDLGWFPRGTMVPEFDQAAFSQTAGVIGDPVKSSFGYHIIEVLEGPAERPLEGQALDAAKSKAFQDWLQDQKTRANVQRF